MGDAAGMGPLQDDHIVVLDINARFRQKQARRTAGRRGFTEARQSARVPFLDAGPGRTMQYARSSARRLGHHPERLDALEDKCRAAPGQAHAR
jgi:hypothetical protein